MQKNANETAKETKNMFLQSAKELKAVTTLAACAMFAALAMILNQVASIDIGPYVRIGFSGKFVRSDASFSFPYGYKHGTILPITEEDYERIKNQDWSDHGYQ